MTYCITHWLRHYCFNGPNISEVKGRMVLPTTKQIFCNLQLEVPSQAHSFGSIFQYFEIFIWRFLPQRILRNSTQTYLLSYLFSTKQEFIINWYWTDMTSSVFESFLKGLNFYCRWPFKDSSKPQILAPMVSMVSTSFLSLVATEMVKSVIRHLRGAANMSPGTSALIVLGKRQPQRVQAIITKH